MNLLDKLADILSKRGYNVSKEEESKILARHPNAPIQLVVEVSDNNRVTLDIKTESFQDFIDDVKESEENPREFLEEVIEDVLRAAGEAENIARRSGFMVENRVRRAILDLLDEIEDILES